MAKKKVAKTDSEDTEVIEQLDHDLEEELDHKDEDGGRGFNDPSLAPDAPSDDELTVPKLTGHNLAPKTDFEQVGTNNQSRRDIGAERAVEIESDKKLNEPK